MTIEGRKEEIEEESKSIEKESKDKESKEKELKEMFFLRVIKRKGVEDGEYNDIYEVKFPVTFYFDKEDIYDGLSFDTDDITEEEAEILEELLNRIADAEGMSITDEQTDDETSE